MAVCRASVVAPGLRGRIGNAVFVSDGDRTILREAPPKRPERSPEQRNAMAMQTRAAKLYKRLTPEEGAEWAAYAARNPLPPKADGRPGSARADNVYGSLAMRYQAIHGMVEPPRTPPETAFLGDAVGIVARGSEAGLVLEADRANAEGVVTQVIVQPLASAHRRTYATKYVHAAIVAFTEEEPTVTVPVRSEWVAVAVRFLRASTGQASATIELGKLRAGGA